MFPDLEFIKTALNAITARFRHVKSDVDAVKVNVDAVKANVDAVKAKQPDFEEPDSKSHAYIKNKPCYDYIEPDVTIWETNSAPNGSYGMENLGDVGGYFIEGETYTWISGGVATTYTATSENGNVSVGPLFQASGTDVCADTTFDTYQRGTASSLRGPLRRYKKLDTKFYDAVTSVNGETGDVEITPEGIGAAKIEPIQHKTANGSVTVRYSIIGRNDMGLVPSLYLGKAASGFQAGLFASDGNISFWWPTVLKNVNTPVDNTDAANKAYVDTAVSSARDYIVLNSSTEDSTKQFKITVDDSGTLTATEVTE